MSDLMIQSGPCQLCGATNYPLSMGGPSICCSCDCGIPPEVNKLRIQVYALEQKLRVAAEENLRLRIDASKGLYTPTKEAEYERMKAQLRVAREGLEAIARKGDGIKSDMIDWANIGKNSKDEAREVLKKIK